MRNLIKSIKELKDTTHQEQPNFFEIRKSSDAVIEELINYIIKEFTWRINYMKRDDIPQDKKDFQLKNMAFLYMHMRPFEQQMKEMNPDMLKLFDKLKIKTEEIINEFKKNKPSGMRTW